MLTQLIVNDEIPSCERTYDLNLKDFHHRSPMLKQDLKKDRANNVYRSTKRILLSVIYRMK